MWGVIQDEVAEGCLYHQNQNGQHLERHLELQGAIIQVHLGLEATTGLLRSTMRSSLITRNSQLSASATTMWTTTTLFVSPRLSKNIFTPHRQKNKNSVI